MNKQVVNLFTKYRRSQCQEIKRFYLRLAVWLFVETLVRPHVQDHAAALTLEALFVPYLEQLHFGIIAFFFYKYIYIYYRNDTILAEKRFLYIFVEALSRLRISPTPRKETLNRDFPGKQKAFNRGNAFVSLLLIGSI